MNLEAFESEQKEPTVVKLQISSIILTTNAFGEFSKCTIISELMSDEDLEPLGADAQKLWERFIHQPQTGRCLVFLLILGKLCQKIANKGRKAMEYLVKSLNLQVRYLEPCIGMVYRLRSL